jgi:hypothetical protein
MNFRVIWRRSLEEHIAAAFVEALEEDRDAEAITRAIAEIDRRLQRNPRLRKGNRGQDKNGFCSSRR